MNLGYMNGKLGHDVPKVCKGVSLKKQGWCVALRENTPKKGDFE